MIPQELTSSLAEEGTILKNVFHQLSAEAIYYAYLSKQSYETQRSSNIICVYNKSDMTPSGHRKWAYNKGDELHNCRKNKDLQNKNKLFHNLLCEEYLMLKSKSICEIKEGLYQAIIAGYGPKTIKMDKNHSNHKRFILKAKESSLTNQNPNDNYASSKNPKIRFRSDFKNISSDNEDSNIRSIRKNEMYLMWGLAGDYRLMKWKRKREKAEGRYQKYLANRRKRELKKEMAQSMMKHAMGFSYTMFNSSCNPSLGLAIKPAKKLIRKKPFMIQKSLGYDYRHCLKKKRNREDDETFYQLYLASITPPLPHSISGAPYVVSSIPKFAAPKVLCTGRPKGKKLNVSFDLPDEDDTEALESKDLFLFQCLALHAANMSMKQRCEGSEAHYYAAIAMKDKNNIKL